MNLFPARYAENIFWMGRYLERAENLAVLLDVTYRFSSASSNEQNWNSLIALHCDEEAFAERYDSITAENVIHFYLSESAHADSIYACLESARYNARQLRSVISTEMWVQINTMYNDFLTTIEKRKSVDSQDLWRFLSDIRKQCQLLFGIAEGTLYRDQGWYFFMLGKSLERADQTTRLLDIKYHLLLPSPKAVGSTIDSAQWFALLRSASGYHAFRREYPYVISPSTVAGFLLLEKRFPRSVAASIRAIGHSLDRLHNQFGLHNTARAIKSNQSLVTQLEGDNIKRIIGSGMHEYLDNIQLHLIEIGKNIAENLFDI